MAAGAPGWKGRGVRIDRVGRRDWKDASPIFLFFFQAEDGIRDLTVTGVQTCALPIYVHDAALALGDVEVARLEQPHQNVLDVFADVARFGQRRRVRDRERHVEDARERLRQQRLAHAGGAEQHDVALVELDFVVAPRRAARVDALVVIVDRDGERLLGAFLPDHVLVQHALDLGRRGDLSDRFGDFALFVLRQDLVAERDALIANVDRRAGDEFPDRIFRLSAEGAAEMLIVRHRALTWETRRGGARSSSSFRHWPL